MFVWVLRRITWIEKNFREKKNKIREKDEISRMFVCECLDEYSELRRIFANVCVWVLRRIYQVKKKFRECLCEC